jgi:hypothetical protein
MLIANERTLQECRDSSLHHKTSLPPFLQEIHPKICIQFKASPVGYFSFLLGRERTIDSLKDRFHYTFIDILFKKHFQRNEDFGNFPGEEQYNLNVAYI